jgi:hypothetical protein
VQFLSALTPELLVSLATIVVGVLGIVTAIAAVWWQMRKQWLLHSAQLITELVAQFRSDELVGERRKLARLIAERVDGKVVQLEGDYPVLGFFENIGLLARRDALDKEMVFNKFGWEVVRYHDALTHPTDLIAETRERHREPSLYEETEWLYRCMLRMYRRKGIDMADPGSHAARVHELLVQELEGDSQPTARSTIHDATAPGQGLEQTARNQE